MRSSATGEGKKSRDRRGDGVGVFGCLKRIKRRVFDQSAFTHLLRNISGMAAARSAASWGETVGRGNRS